MKSLPRSVIEKRYPPPAMASAISSIQMKLWFSHLPKVSRPMVMAGSLEPIWS